MSVSQPIPTRLTMPVMLAWPIVVAGLVSIFATYWDEAWHTDIGRDSAWAVPHVLLYGSFAVVGLGVAGWVSRAIWVTRSLSTVVRQWVLLAAALGGLGSLAAAPVDALWHERYGRDAALWSPPHMLALFASAALIMGVLSGLPTRASTVRTWMCVLLTGNALAVVFEYEADVPQFTEVLYLPIFLTAGLLVAWLTRRTVPTRTPMTTVVLGYVTVRLAIMAALAALGRSTPDWPIAVLGLAFLDIPFRTALQRYAAGAGAAAALAWVASLTGLASPDSNAVAVTAAPVIAAAALILLVSALANRAQVLLPIGIAIAAVTLSAGWPTPPAQAHDPGQGEAVTKVELTVTSSGDGQLDLRVYAPGGCSNLVATRVAARRAGSTLRGPLRPVADCTFEGTVTVAPLGRWFAYVELADKGRPVEAWLPIDADKQQSMTRTRELYLPAGATPASRNGQLALGALIYLIGAALLAAGVLATRRPFHAATGCAVRS